MPELKAGPGNALRLENGELFVDGFVPLEAEFTVYVAKAGDDSNDGLSNQTSKLTIGAAVAVASAILGSDPECCAVRVYVRGAGVYEESFTVPANVILTGEAATVVGRITMEARARVIIYKHVASANDQIMLLKTGSNGGWYTTFISDGRGQSGTLTGVTNARSDTDGSILFVEAALMFVSANGKGIEDTASGFGHNHFNVKDLYLAGNGAEGLRFVGGQSDGVGYIDHILKFGSPTNTVGIRIGNSSIGRVIACEIIADTAYNIASPNGELYLICPRVVGTTTGTLANT